jgi:hypothetical protein
VSPFLTRALHCSLSHARVRISNGPTHAAAAAQIHRLFTAEVKLEARRLEFARACIAEMVRNRSKDPYALWEATIDEVNTQVRRRRRGPCACPHLDAPCILRVSVSSFFKDLHLGKTRVLGSPSDGHKSAVNMTTLKRPP